MKKYSVIFISALIISSIGAFLILRNIDFTALTNDSCDDTTTTKAIKSIANNYFLEISYTQDSKSLPEQWQKQPINGKSQPITSHNLCRAIEILSPEFKKYPQKIIQQILEKIVFFDSLEFYGINYGGTSLNNTIYLVVGDLDKGFTKNEIAKVFHHELSSIFLYENNFFIDDWLATNKKGFSYSDSTEEALAAIQQGIEKNVSKATYQSGFLSEYGKSSLENDFNIFAETLFTEPQKLKYLSLTYPRIEKKSQLLQQHYLQYSPDFNFDQ